MGDLYDQTQDEIAPIDLRFSGDELEAELDRITSFIDEQVAKQNVEGVVVGLSGGIDSTAVAHLAVEALGVEAVHGLVLPREVNRDKNMNDAEQVATDLGITYDVVEIDPLLEQFLDLEMGENPETTEEEWEHRFVGNTSARIRMTIAYLLANRENKLVLGTGNRVELGLGYVTKYGDGGVDCNPIGDLYKQQVRQLAAHFGVDESLVQKTPTGGMVDYDTDEEEFGVDYDTLDAILALAFDDGTPVSAAARIANTTPEVIEQIVEMKRGSEHKRTVPPTPADTE
ncbi:NAD+ synthase [Halococcus hamelinensis]|uniref:NH(3)-dependent NAD(+) synthetase n=1 Tax=Halococcus hamelinensis 100A6 TaxID=1132509 RepID=M0LVI9_9EURY|nr:NAD+ synthase [Halococcus hamelinensis]EMA37582.1 NAD synthetase [Halococcus hamelinensis 100A6]